jgi:ATP-binding cassette subfamily G (WHITE) protein 2 (SNQ2)
VSSPEEEEEEKGEFELERFMREGHLEKRNGTGESANKVGVVYKHLTVKGLGSSAAFVKTLPDAIMGTFGPDLYRILSNWLPALRFDNPGELRTLHPRLYRSGPARRDDACARPAGQWLQHIPQGHR